MDSQPTEDAKSRDNVDRETLKTSETLGAITSFVNDDHVADIMQMQQSV